MIHPWINFAQRVKAIAQIGKNYTKDPYDRERYLQLEEISHEMISTLVNANITAVDQCFLPEGGYVTPKVDLRAGVFKDDKILLVKKCADGRWSLPGGWADASESPTQGVIRKVREKTGLIVDNPRLVALVDRQLHEYEPAYLQHIYKVFFLCDLAGGEPEPSQDVLEMDFFSLDDLPELSVERVLPKDITRLTNYYNGIDTSVYMD